jgi:hypothetical protein
MITLSLFLCCSSSVIYPYCIYLASPDLDDGHHYCPLSLLRSMISFTSVESKGQPRSGLFVYFLVKRDQLQFFMHPFWNSVNSSLCRL